MELETPSVSLVFMFSAGEVEVPNPHLTRLYPHLYLSLLLLTQYVPGWNSNTMEECSLTTWNTCSAGNRIRGKFKGPCTEGHWCFFLGCFQDNETLGDVWFLVGCVPLLSRRVTFFWQGQMIWMPVDLSPPPNSLRIHDPQKNKNHGAQQPKQSHMDRPSKGWDTQKERSTEMH